MNRTILVVDDDVALREMMSMTLKKEGFDVVSAASVAQARTLIAHTSFDLVVSDIYLGDGTAIELLEDLRGADKPTAVILVTAQGTVETAAAAREAGVFDYLAKPFQLDQLVGCVTAALGKAPKATVAHTKGPETMIIGSHPTIVEVYKAVARVAPLPIPILLRGETGTGKELVARALHKYGASPNGPFVAINCGAIPETLLESELFGHRRGAFTGAVRDNPGAIQAARCGTLFLDEVGELPPLLQVKLLRFLQDGEVRPLGAEATLTVETRVVAATHQDLSKGIASGGIREDFFYRLAAYQIEIPPLRDRASDIPLLIEHFERLARERLDRPNLGGASRETHSLLEHYDWPGNVRELEHLVQRCLIDFGSMSDPQRVKELLRQPSNEAEVPTPGRSIGDDITLEALERLHIEAVLAKNGGNRTRTAEILGIERKSLYRKINRLEISLPGDNSDLA